MDGDIEKILNSIGQGADGIYGGLCCGRVHPQAQEIALRTKIALEHPNDVLGLVNEHHSAPVMDKEVHIFLQQLPHGATILDIGGCTGWHWRNIYTSRPDVKVILCDFVRENFMQAFSLLGSNINKQVFCLHADATDLPLPDACIDAVWSVQVLQHIPNVDTVLAQIYRVLKTNGFFACYNLNDYPQRRYLPACLYHDWYEGPKQYGSLYIAKAGAELCNSIEKKFSQRVTTRYSEIIFDVGKKMRTYSGKEGALLGRIDAQLSGSFPLLSCIARQRSFHVKKSSGRL